MSVSQLVVPNGQGAPIRNDNFKKPRRYKLIAHSFRRLTNWCRGPVGWIGENQDQEHAWRVLWMPIQRIATLAQGMRQVCRLKNNGRENGTGQGAVHDDGKHGREVGAFPKHMHWDKGKEVPYSADTYLYSAAPLAPRGLGADTQSRSCVLTATAAIPSPMPMLGLYGGRSSSGLLRTRVK